jgi:iron complex outermembrane receptor protein
MTIRRMILAASASAIVLGAASGAAAQAAPPAAAKQFELQEVVVTAQRRAENLQNVPMSVSSLSTDTLKEKGIVNLTDLTTAVPGLLYGRSTNFNQPTIRGVGTRSANAGDEPNIATYIDGVYQPDSISAVQELSNIERVEVLKGPQGTLYGRNATGGAINIVTRDPTFEPHFDVAGTYGRFNYRKGAGSVSGPLAGDWLAGSLAITGFADDGYIKNIYTGQTQGQASGEVLRAKLLARPIQELTLQLNGLYSHGVNNVLISSYAIDGNTSIRIPATLNNVIFNPRRLPVESLIGTQPWTTGTAFAPQASAIQKMLDGHFSYDMEWATLSGLVARGSTTARNLSLTDSSALALQKTDYYSTTNYWDEELLLTSPGNQTVTWIAGVQGFQGRSHFKPLISSARSATTGLYTPAIILYGQDTKSWAGFVEATWNAMEQLYLTGGLRYSWDEKFGFNQTSTATVVGPKVSAKHSWDNLAPRFVARYEFATNSNVYASFSEAYKSGTFSATTVAGIQSPVGPEKIKSFEVGLKTNLGSRLRFTASAFDYKYTDLQVSTLQVVNGASLVGVQNAGKVNGHGGEITLDWLATDDLSFDAGLSFLQTKFSDFPNAQVLVPTSTINPSVAPLSGNTNASRDLEGKELIRAPNWTINIGAHYKHDLGPGQIEANASFFFSDSYFAELYNRVTQPAYTIINTSVTWRSNDRYYVTVFGENLTDEVYAIGHIISAFGDQTQAAKPRWFGVTVGFNY